MTDKILWRRTTRTDILGMTGKAAPGGGGGGAKHIALGVDSNKLPIKQFLGVTQCADTQVTISPVPGLVSAKTVEFACLKSRRGGEWRISRQHLDRYPLWTPRYGFPARIGEYDSADPPVILVARISGEYHARFCMLSHIAGVSKNLDAAVRHSSLNTGIEDFTAEMGGIFGLEVPPAEEDARIQPTAHAPVAPPQPQLGGKPPSPALSTKSVVTRYIRDSKAGRELKELYKYRCTFCALKIDRPHDNPYVETCHVRPLNQKGPDDKSNMVILCPNHHVELDFGAVSIDPDTLILHHIDPTNSLNGMKIQLKHHIDMANLDFHFKQWKKRTLMGY